MSTPQEKLEAARERIRELLERGDATAAGALAAELDLHASDLADVIEAFPDELGVLLVGALPSELASEALAEMEQGEDRAEILAALTPERSAALLVELPDDDAADLIGELEPVDQRRILEALSAEDAGELIGLLEYDQESAGGLMTTELVAVEDSLTAAAAIEQVREQGRVVGRFYVVFVVDEARRLLGTLRLDELVTADPESHVREIVVEPLATVTPEVDQEEVARLISRYNLPAIAVVGEDGVLLGRVTFDDVIDAIEAEQTEDILRLAGLADEGHLRHSWSEAVRARLPWLALNLVTAALASSVVYAFSETIESAVVLAAIMPIIAGLGGNAGTQALAVTVRSIALEREPSSRRRALALHVNRELAVGVANGLILGLVTAALTTLLGGDRMLGVVVLLAMWGNLVVAGFLGSFVPSIMDRLGLDPAVSSSMFVTPFTDLCGFLFLLGLGSALLL